MKEDAFKHYVQTSLEDMVLETVRETR